MALTIEAIYENGVLKAFADLQAGDAVFVDANTLIYHFTNHPKYGAACTAL